MITAPNLPRLIASRYVPVRLIAKGGMGAVYEVEHVRTGERLALKVLLSSVGSSADELDRFKREARASARIKSEHVVHVTDADVAPELDGAPFLVMELLEGADLEREAAASRPAPAIVVDWLRQVARGLDKAHRLGIVHRDLKPENLFLARAENRAPIVKILDFGIVKMIEEGPGGTGSGEILGTPKYMAPEQASSKGRVTSAADRYSLGLVAYRLLTGESYYRGDVLSILAQILHSPLEPPSQRHPELGSAFDSWFMRACHRDPEARFASALEQVEALSEALGLPTTRLDVARRLTRKDPEVRSRRTLVAVVSVVVGLAAVSLAGMLLKRRPSTTGGSGATPTASISGGTPAIPSMSPTTQAPPPPEASGAETKPIAVTPPLGSAKPRPRLRRPPPPDTRPAASVVSDTAKPPVPDPYADQK